MFQFGRQHPAINVTIFGPYASFSPMPPGG